MHIRNGLNMCTKIISFDANALYLWALTQNMPTGTFLRRKADQNVKPIRAKKHQVVATEWLEWEARVNSYHV